VATPAQVEANRKNALASTGPRTEHGRERSARNALSHGLSAEKLLLLEYESAEEFEQLADAIWAWRQPVDDLEAELTRQLIGCIWRLRRVPQIERDVLALSEWHSETQRARQRYEAGERGLERKTTGFSTMIANAQQELERLERDTERPDPFALGHAFILDAEGPAALTKLGRHETRLHAQALRLKHELDRLDAQRTGTAAPPPIAVDLTGGAA